MFQLQQIVASKGRTRAETPTPASDSGKRENGKVAVHTAVRRTGFGNQKAACRGMWAPHIDTIAL